MPTYVVEFLLGRYCASTDPAEIEEGLQIVEKQLQGRTVRTGEEELFKSRSRDQGSVKIIDIVRARLDTRSYSYMAEVPSLAIRDAQIDDELVRTNERMLTDGFYAEVLLEYDPVIAQERNGRPCHLGAASQEEGHHGTAPAAAALRGCVIHLLATPSSSAGGSILSCACGASATTAFLGIANRAAPDSHSLRLFSS